MVDVSIFPCFLPPDNKPDKQIDAVVEEDVEALDDCIEIVDNFENEHYEEE